jgi:hypothetical protein
MAEMGFAQGYKPDDVTKIKNIFANNLDLNFVQRIATPGKYPNLPLQGTPYGKKGDYGTHLMSYGELGDKAIVYPMIIHDPKTNALTLLSPDDAYKHAVDTGEYIPFSDPKEADWFSQNYKKVWENKE